MPDHKRFYLQRDVDETGASGTGRVADGVLWADGTASLRWHGVHSSLVHWSSLDDAIAIHGHDGKTFPVWIDDPETGVTSAGIPRPEWEPVDP